MAQRERKSLYSARPLLILNMTENNLSSISQADTLVKMGEFWDTHDFTEFDTDAPDMECTINCAFDEGNAPQLQAAATNTEAEFPFV